jgi:ornithine cyclodeaminase
VLVIEETAARRLVGPAEAISAVEQAFRSVSTGAARNFPVVREVLTDTPTIYGIKSGAVLSDGLLGLKIGGWWPGNPERGLERHQSTTVLTDPETGRPSALVASNYLTGIRTAAAAAIAIRELARSDARVLAIVGAGAQARYQIEAARLVRNIGLVLVADLDNERAEALAAQCRQAGVDARPSGVQEAVQHCDILVTVTPARSPVVRDTWVRPGTHISAMGADTRGKQELEASLLLRASVFVDDWLQASNLGECQHAIAAGFTQDAIAGSLPDLLDGRIVGRRSPKEVTIFDGTGLAVQDLAIAAAALERCGVASGQGIHRIEFAAA